jgi:LEA14-like dessication related protein
MGMVHGRMPVTLQKEEEKMIKRSKIFIFALLVLFFNISVFAGVKEDIYSKLKCCNCSEDFTSCVCAHAKELKAYIDALLEAGLGKDEIFIKIAKKFSLDKITDETLRKSIEEKLITEAGENRPQLFIEPLSYDLGKISKSRGKLELKVKIQNKGNEPLKITNLKTTCACTTVQLKNNKYVSPVFGTKGAQPGWETAIEPKKKGELIIVTDLNHAHVSLGQMMRTVEVSSNDPIKTVVNIEFKAEIVE